MVKEGLPIVEGSYPHLIHGQDAINFIKAKQVKLHKPLEVYEFRCFGCRKASKAKEDLATLEISTPKVGNLKAFCIICGTKLNRKISLSRLPEFQKVLNIQQPTKSKINVGFQQ
jgi:hypothetical protein